MTKDELLKDIEEYIYGDKYDKHKEKFYRPKGLNRTQSDLLLLAMCAEQVLQGNKFDPSIFANDFYSSVGNKGFAWSMSYIATTYQKKRLGKPDFKYFGNLYGEPQHWHDLTSKMVEEIISAAIKKLK